MPLSTMVNEAVVVAPELAADEKIKLNGDTALNRPVKQVSSTKKKNGKKIRPARVVSTKASSKDVLPTPDSKKLKRNLGTPTPIEADYNVCSSVPSVASTFSTEGSLRWFTFAIFLVSYFLTVIFFILTDSDLPDSIVSPTDEETCSYVTDGEEEYVVGDTVSSCSDLESPVANVAVVVPSATDAVIQPALRFSALNLYPPFLNFCLHNEKGKTFLFFFIVFYIIKAYLFCPILVTELPWPVRRHLKWKLSSITPIVVRKTVANSGFRVIKDPKEWIGTWGKHMKSVLFKQILPHQKVALANLF